jgi:hypothetical protein
MRKDKYRMPSTREVAAGPGYKVLNWNSILAATGEPCIVLAKFPHPGGKGSLYRIMLSRNGKQVFQDVNLGRLQKPKQGQKNV